MFIIEVEHASETILGKLIVSERVNDIQNLLSRVRNLRLVIDHSFEFCEVSISCVLIEVERRSIIECILFPFARPFCLIDISSIENELIHRIERHGEKVSFPFDSLSSILTRFIIERCFHDENGVCFHSTCSYRETLPFMSEFFEFCIFFFREIGSKQCEEGEDISSFKIVVFLSFVRDFSYLWKAKCDCIEKCITILSVSEEDFYLDFIGMHRTYSESYEL